MIYCIWYPSGGFGHFLNGVLTLHGENFVRPKTSTISFGEDGNSHALELTAPKYYHDPVTYDFEFDFAKNYSVLVDNGINNEDTRFLKFFTNATVVKVCYNDQTWPIVANTLIRKAMNSTLENALTVDMWETNADWAIREKYFLFLRDHSLRHAWKVDEQYNCLSIDDIIKYPSLDYYINQHICKVAEFECLHQNWYNTNAVYLKPTAQAKEIIKSIESNVNVPLTHITDFWSQAVVNYYIWITYNFEVPANDYSNWFSSTTEIQKMLKNASYI